MLQIALQYTLPRMKQATNDQTKTENVNNLALTLVY
jgi:hypothetical protein